MKDFAFLKLITDGTQRINKSIWGSMISKVGSRYSDVRVINLILG